ncbi:MULTISPECIES: GntR family transcriptional regulator [unclassified Salinibacterium]|uniref:GntR family transcriptional regulator n=1 Tax=unclassified Salinibacterium TaxID=2632331 RepID=UPI00141F39F9|nr:MULTISPECIES: GntR family transcriptional regulator [unclassified Salinibacterium]
MRASDRAYLTLRDEIIDWELPPGSVLAEVEQSTRLGVSRTPLREALARLSADGLVTQQTGRGLVVTDVSVDNIRQLFEVRRALEEQAARLAAERGDPDVFAALERELRAVPEMLEADDPARHAYYDLVRRFDEALDDAVANPYLVTALRNLRTHLVRIRRLAKDDTPRLRAAAAEHLTIAQAIVARDADLAAHATHLHLHRALQNALATTVSRGPA